VERGSLSWVKGGLEAVVGPAVKVRPEKRKLGDGVRWVREK